MNITKSMSGAPAAIEPCPLLLSSTACVASVVVSCFDPVRREVARLALEKLVSDGRIHPGRIEEVVNKSRKEVDTAIVETQKIGYDGVMMFEIGDGGGDPVEVLKKSVKARERLEKTFVTF